MGEKINKEFDDFQKHLEEKEKRLKMNVSFEPDENIEREIEELKRKEIVL
jgi:hypothetical protein